MFSLRTLKLLTNKEQLASLPEGKLLINTINAHSFNTAKKDEAFAEALMKGGVLIPDGISIVNACKWLDSDNKPKERIAGWDLFVSEMTLLNNRSIEKKSKVMFFGSNENVLSRIVKKAAEVYPNLDVVTFSPPYKHEFSIEDNESMLKAINDANPDLLWVGMTAPKQEKWVYSNWDKLNIHCHVGTIGAVFDFFAETVKRAPESWQNNGMEWLYRLCKEPRRMWRRYLLGNIRFLLYVIEEKFSSKK